MHSGASKRSDPILITRPSGSCDGQSACGLQPMEMTHSVALYKDRCFLRKARVEVKIVAARFGY